MSRISSASQAEVIRPIHRIFHSSEPDVVRLGRRIGVGAEGEVYEIQDRSDLVAKIYHQPPPPEKAEKLVALSRLGNERLFNLSAWPVDVLRDAPDGAVAGFIMKKISGAEEVHALHSPKSRLQKFPDASWAFLIYVAANIARAVAAIHEHGFVIGDLNPKNILVTRKATVYLLDVDSFQVIADGKTYRCDGGFPEYTPPELQGVAFRKVDRTQEHDYFGLAVVIFQLLFMGRHPFSGNFLGAGEMSLERAIRESRFAYGADAGEREMRQPPGTLALDSMPSWLVGLFRRAFLTPDRPKPRKWIEPLDMLAKALKKCVLHSGHYYYKELRDCPWCGIESCARVRLFNFLIPGAGSQRGHFRLDEIWKEIESVQVKDTPLIPRDKLLSETEPSADVAVFAGNRHKRFILSLVYSVIVGLAIPLLIGFPLAFLYLILAGLAFFSIAKAELNLTGQAQSLFQNQQTAPKDPFVRRIWSLNREAEYRARQIEERWEKEASDRAFLARLDNLRNQKETYENLAQIRDFRLTRLAQGRTKDQFDEFLNGFVINHPDIAGIGDTAIAELLSQGVLTAADITEKRLGRIPGLNESRVRRLLEWRQELEKKFVIAPGKRVTPQARIAVEKEIDSLRLRLEHELGSGAHYLRCVKQEVETNRRKLQPALAKARRELAQAKKDLEVAGKRNSFVPILTTLIIAFIIGLATSSSHESAPVRDNIGNPREGPVVPPPPPPPPAVRPENKALDKGENRQSASDFYMQGMRFSSEEKF